MSKTSQRKASQRDRNKRIAKNINAGGGFPFPTSSVSELKLARKLAKLIKQNTTGEGNE